MKADIGGLPGLHRRLNGVRNLGQTPIVRQGECGQAVALEKSCPVAVTRWGVGEHHRLLSQQNDSVFDSSPTPFRCSA
jgi:hypothetical protein